MSGERERNRYIAADVLDQNDGGVGHEFRSLLVVDAVQQRREAKAVRRAAVDLHHGIRAHGGRKVLFDLMQNEHYLKRGKYSGKDRDLKKKRQIQCGYIHR